MAQQIWSICRYVDADLLIGYRNGFEERSPRPRIRLQLQNPGMIDAEAELFGGTEHAVGLDAADLAALELEAARQRRTDGSERVGLAGLHIRRAAHDFERLAAARVHQTE